MSIAVKEQLIKEVLNKSEKSCVNEKLQKNNIHAKHYTVTFNCPFQTDSGGVAV